MDTIVNWLQEDLEVGPLEFDIEKECSNGVLLGRILTQYGLQTDLNSFSNKQTPDAKLANFKRLEPVLRSLNVRFDSHIASQLMTEERGVALKFLQQLKVTLDATKTGATNPRSTSLLLKTNRLAQKPQFRAMQEQTFDTMLRFKTGNPKEYRMQNHLRLFEEEAVRQQRFAEQNDALDRLDKEQYLSDMRTVHLSKLSENKAYLQDWERQGRINHAKNVATQKERERREKRFEVSVRDAARRGTVAESRSAAEDVAGGIGAFEDSLRRFQVPPPPSSPSLVLPNSPHRPQRPAARARAGGGIGVTRRSGGGGRAGRRATGGAWGRRGSGARREAGRSFCSRSRPRCRRARPWPATPRPT